MLNAFPKSLPWKITHFRFYKDEKEVNATNVSTCGLQKQSHKGKLRSNEVAKQPRLHIEHMNSYHKTILTRTSLYFATRACAIVL